MVIDRTILQRMSFVMQKRISRRILEEGNGINVQVVVDQMSEDFVAIVRAQMMGRDASIEVDCGPDGWWQTLRRLLGMRYRSRMTTVYAMQLFPQFPSDGAYYYIDTEKPT